MKTFTARWTAVAFVLAIVCTHPDVRAQTVSSAIKGKPGSGSIGFGVLATFVGEAIHPGFEVMVHDPQLGLVADFVPLGTQKFDVGVGLRHPITPEGVFLGGGAGMLNGNGDVYAEAGATSAMGRMFNFVVCGRGIYFLGEQGGWIGSFAVGAEFVIPKKR